MVYVLEATVTLLAIAALGFLAGAAVGVGIALAVRGARHRTDR